MKVYLKNVDPIPTDFITTPRTSVKTPAQQAGSAHPLKAMYLSLDTECWRALHGRFVDSYPLKTERNVIKITKTYALTVAIVLKN